MKDDRLYVIHIQESISRIEEYTAEGKDTFLRDTKTQDAVLRNLQTLAESTRRISEELKQRHAEVDWRSIAGFRNVAVHDYPRIDVEQIWNIVDRDLPGLRGTIAEMPRELGEG